MLTILKLASIAFAVGLALSTLVGLCLLLWLAILVMADFIRARIPAKERDVELETTPGLPVGSSVLQYRQAESA